MPKAAIYVRAPLTPGGSSISTDDQETACREYCLTRNLTVSGHCTTNANWRSKNFFCTANSLQPRTSRNRKSRPEPTRRLLSEDRVNSHTGSI